MDTDQVFCQLSEETQDLLDTSRAVFDHAVDKLLREERQRNSDLFSVLYRRAGITDPYLKGERIKRQAMESGESAIKDAQEYFDDEVQELKEQLNNRNRAIMMWGLTRPECAGRN